MGGRAKIISSELAKVCLQASAQPWAKSDKGAPFFDNAARKDVAMPSPMRVLLRATGEETTQLDQQVIRDVTQKKVDVQ